MIDSPSAARKPAAKTKSHINGRTMGGDEPFALVDETQRLAFDDGAQGGEVDVHTCAPVRDRK